MFRSSSCHTIDDKGRLIIPARFRKVLKAEDDYGIVVSSKDGCIFAFTFSEWKDIEDRLKTVKTASMQRFKRFFLGNACPLTCDKQDRVLIPQNLRTYAQIDKEVVLVGVLDRFEIWAKEKWEQEQKEMEQEIKQEDVREEIASIGL
ncbi:division/cell wall cluster transcriptional repressor MraZ [uncultured Desulfobacter sp.]|uniref:division/cell wall cluster transcriptional repressor MraZ n=1 Tax=uncultured Desulfobacter sp. TaxID=240139 RepID=UPI0029F55673|nr:division/cell wall cluster transcriptional repressor MraZ [uncultured Desulfobacter sp.]